jgi:RNA polymerase sigma-70 factor (ECF subfamily)
VLTNDLEALKELFQLHSGNIFKFAVRILKNSTEADDIVQDVFLRIWKYREKYCHQQNFRAWALRICLNLCLDMKRMQRKNLTGFISAFDEGDLPENSLEETIITNEQTLIVSKAFYELPFEYQQLLSLRLDGDLSVPETAETLGCSIRTVHYKTAMAIDMLKRLAGEKQ